MRRSERARRREADVERLFPLQRGKVVRFPSPWAGAEATKTTGVAVGCVAMGAWFVPIFVRLLHERSAHEAPFRAEVLGEAQLGPVAAALTLVAGTASLRLASRALEKGRHGRLLFLLAAGAILNLVSAGLECRLIRACSGLHSRPATLAAILGADFVLALLAGCATAWVFAGYARRVYHPARPSPLERLRLCCTCSAVLSTAGMVLSFSSL